MGSNLFDACANHSAGLNALRKWFVLQVSQNGLWVMAVVQ